MTQGYSNAGRRASRTVLLGLALALATTATFADWELGMSYFKQGKYVEAIAEFEATLVNAPEYDFGYYMVGNSYLKLKKYNDAVVSFKKAIDINPGKFAYHGNLAQAHFQLKKYGDVITTLDKAESLAESARDKELLHQFRGLSLFQSKLFDRAVDDLKKANPSANFSVAVALGSSCRATGDWKCVQDSFDKAVAQNAKHGPTLSQYAGALLEMAVREQNAQKKDQTYAKAADIARKLIDVEKSADSHKKLGDALLGAGKYKEAVAEYQTVLKMEPKNCAAMLSLSQSSGALQDWPATLEWGKKSVECGENKHLGYNQMAYAYIKTQKWQEAKDAATKSDAVKPNAQAKNLIKVAAEKKDYEEHNQALAAAEAEYEAKQKAEEARVKAEQDKIKAYQTKTGQGGGGGVR